MYVVLAYAVSKPPRALYRFKVGDSIQYVTNPSVAAWILLVRAELFATLALV